MAKEEAIEVEGLIRVNGNAFDWQHIHPGNDVGWQYSRISRDALDKKRRFKGVGYQLFWGASFFSLKLICIFSRLAFVLLMVVKVLVKLPLGVRSQKKVIRCKSFVISGSPFFIIET